MRLYLWGCAALMAIVGVIIRFQYLELPGFIFDTTVYYEWARLANTQGFVWFWRDYRGWFDYLPGALFFFMFLDWLSRLFADGYIPFVSMIKIVNAVFDLLFVALVYDTARNYGNFTRSASFFLASVVWLLPSIWFVSSLWGQVDGIVVTICLLGIVLSHRSLEVSNSKFHAFTSGVLFALGFWIKMQAILFFPLMVLFHINHRNYHVLKKQLVGFCLTTIAIIIVPLVVHPPRLWASLTVMLQRADNMTVSANTFWLFVGLAKHTSYPLLRFGDVTILTLEQSAYAIGLGVGIFLTLMFFGRISSLNLFAYLRQRNLSLSAFMWMQTCVCVAYFAFFPKMYERYLYAGVVAVWILFATTKSTALRILIGTAGIALNVAMFLNMIDVYVWWGYRDPIWIFDFVHRIKANIAFISAGFLMWGFMLLMIGYYLYIRSFRESAPKQSAL